MKLRMNIMISGKRLDMGKLVNDADAKGDFVEYNLYDFFENSDFDVALLKTKFDTSKKPIETSQRFSKNYGIIVPDLICQKRQKELLLIESKGRWICSSKKFTPDDRAIEINKFDPYVNFYNNVFQGKSRTNDLAKSLVCFADVNYIWSKGGQIHLSFIDIEILMNVVQYKKCMKYGKPNYLWRESDLREYYKTKTISFDYDEDYNVFSSKYCNDIYSKDRNIMIIDSQKDMNNILQNYQ